MAFNSWASNLVEGDTNHGDGGSFYGLDVFVHDRCGLETTRVSVDSQGRQGLEGNSFDPDVSPDGRFVAFESSARNLVEDAGDGHGDILVRDRLLGATFEASREMPGTEQYEYFTGNPSISLGGAFVAFDSSSEHLVMYDFNRSSDVFVYDRKLDSTTTASLIDNHFGNDWSGLPSISDDGRYVAFMSAAPNLVPGDTNGIPDIFVRDRQNNQNFRVSFNTQGEQKSDLSYLPSLSGNGRCLVYLSRPVVYTGAREEHVFFHDRQSGETVRITDDPSTAFDYFNEYVTPRVSDDCRFVAFSSNSPNLVEGDTNGTWDVFLHDREAGLTTLVSVNDFGDQGNDFSLGSALSGDGRFVAFFSRASNLVDGDTNKVADVFVRGPLNAAPPAPVLIFPQFVTGEIVTTQKAEGDTRSRSRVILINNSDQTDSGVILFQDPGGQPSPVPIGGSLISKLPFSLAPWSSLDLLTDDDGPLRSGPIRVFSDLGTASRIEGTETFEIQGRFVSIASSPLLRQTLSYVTVDDTESTGIAVYNPDQQRGLKLLLTLRNEMGLEQSSRILDLGPDRSLVGYVTEPAFFADFFDTLQTPFRGVLEIGSTDDRSFAVLGLVQKIDSGALIGSQLIEDTTSRGRLVFPHFVNGQYLDQGHSQSSRTRIILIDPAGEQGQISFRDALGVDNPLQIGAAYAASFGFDTAAGGSAEYRSDGSGPLRSGTIEIVSELGESSRLRAWESLEAGGDFVTVPSALLSSCQQTYVSVESGGEDTGLAIYNPGESTELSLDLLLVDETGTRRAIQTIRLPPRHQVVAFITQVEFFQEFLESVGSSFRGTLNLRSSDGSPFALLGLFRRPTGALIGTAPSLSAYKGCAEFELP